MSRRSVTKIRTLKNHRDIVDWIKLVRKLSSKSLNENLFPLHFTSLFVCFLHSHVSPDVNIYFYYFIFFAVATLFTLEVFWNLLDHLKNSLFSFNEYYLVSKLLEIKLYWYHCFNAVSRCYFCANRDCLFARVKLEEKCRRKISHAGHFSGKSLMTSELFFLLFFHRPLSISLPSKICALRFSWTKWFFQERNAIF